MRSTTSRSFKGHYDHKQSTQFPPIANNFLGSINHPTSDTSQLSSFLLLHPELFTWFYVTNKSAI